MRTTLLVAFVTTAFLASCSARQRIKTETALAEVLVSEEQEQALGEKVHAELAKQGVRMSNDPVVVDYVQSLANRLLPSARRDRDTSWHVHVIDDPETVNAFATPGGHIYVYTGLLATADSEAEVAGVLGHEMGHVVGRHSARQMVQQFGLQTVAGLALGQDPSTLAKVAASFAAQGALLAHSRADEIEADEYGVRYLADANYDPHGLPTFLSKLVQKQGRVPRVLSFLSTHPAPQDRVDHVNEFIVEQGLRGTDVGTDRLAPVKRRIGAPVSGR